MGGIPSQALRAFTLALCAASVALAQATEEVIVLNPDLACYTPGARVVVDILLPRSDEHVVGGQFFLQYDV